MDIRVRRDDDLDDLVLLASRVRVANGYPVHLPVGDLRGFLTEPASLGAWVAIDRGDLVGHVALNDATSRPVMRLVERLHPGRPVAFVARLLVDPGSRRQGVGRSLLEHARRDLVGHGRSIFLDVVETEGAAAAISLYRREGWEEIGRVRFDLVDPPLDEIVLRAPDRSEER